MTHLNYGDDAEYAALAHGTYSTYSNRGCRCEKCKAAKRDYDRAKRGSVLTAAQRYAPAQDRVADRIVKRLDGCHVFTGPTNARGYGILGAGKAAGGGMVLAHRVAFEAANGPIPGGMAVCHRCDNPPCCNPAHLFLGTVADNNEDRDRKGRVAWGERSARARLTEQQVLQIRKLRADGLTLQALADQFGVANSTVHAIVARQTWQRLDEEVAS